MESQKIAERIVEEWAEGQSEYSVTFPPDGDTLIASIAAALDAAQEEGFKDARTIIELVAHPKFEILEGKKRYILSEADVKRARKLLTRTKK